MIPIDCKITNFSLNLSSYILLPVTPSQSLGTSDKHGITICAYVKNFVWEVQSKNVFFYRPYKPHCSKRSSSYRTAKCSITTKYSISGSYRTPLKHSIVPGRLSQAQVNFLHCWLDGQSTQTRLEYHSIVFINILVNFDDGSIDEHFILVNKRKILKHITVKIQLKKTKYHNQTHFVIEGALQTHCWYKMGEIPHRTTDTLF